MGLTVLMASVDFEQCVDALYAAAAVDFVQLRDASAKQARAAGDKETAARIKSLRRPVAAAALINHWVRRDPPGLQELLDLGARLRHAQSELDGVAMKRIGSERNSLVGRLVDEVTGSDDASSASVRDQVGATFVASVADPAAEQAVISGRLVSALHYSGFGEVDLSDAVAAPVPAGRQAKDPQRQRRAELTAAQAALDTAQQAHRDAEAAVAAAERALTSAQQAHAGASARARTARRALDQAQEAVRAAETTA